MSDFFLVHIVFCQFFTCIVPCDVDLRVLLIFVPKAGGGGGGGGGGGDDGITRDICLYRSFATRVSQLKIWNF